MKPKQAKEICDVSFKDENDLTQNPVPDAFEFGLRVGKAYWACLRTIIEAIEKAGFKVSITKDGKEYNK